MKNLKLYGVLLFMFTLLSSCATTPNSTIIGKWKFQNKNITYQIINNGVIIANATYNNNRIKKSGKWVLSNNEPPVLKIFADGKLEEELTITFMSKDLMKLKSKSRDEETLVRTK